MRMCVVGSSFTAMLIAVLGIGLPRPALAEDSAPAAKTETTAIDYQRQVFPVLRKYCLGCHDRDAAEGGLVIEPFELFLKGGEHGAAFVPGASDRSRLVRMIEGTLEPKMPPEDNPAPKAEEVALLKAWIDAGAKGPSGAAIDPYLLVTPQIKPAKQPAFAIHALAVSPDGKLLALGGYREIRLVDRATKVIAFRLKDIAGNVTALSFSPDGTKLLSAAGEPGLFGEAALWDVATVKLIRQIRGHTDSLYAAILSPDGKRIATAAYDKMIYFWDAATGQQVGQCKGHNGAVYALSYRAGGKQIASASADSTVKLWNAETGERLETFPQSLKGLYSVAFEPGGKRLAAAGVDNRLRIWQVSESGQEGTNPILFSRFAHQAAILRIEFSKDGKLLATSAEDRTVKIWSTDGYIERLALEAQSDWSSALAFTPDGKLLVVGRQDGTLSQYDTSTGSKQADIVPTAPKPELVRLWPRGVERGKATRIELFGKHFGEATSIQMSHAGLTAKLLPTSEKGETFIEVTATAAVPRGTYDLTVVAGDQKSSPVKLLVDDQPTVLEVEPNSALKQAQAVTLPVSIWGQLGQQGDGDFYAFEAAAGQTIVCDVTATPFGSKTNAVLTLHDAAGRVFDNNNDYDEAADPLIAYTFEKAGKYVVRVRDVLLAGSPEHEYRLTIASTPLVIGVYPLGVAANSTTEVELAGYNLPAGAKVTVASKGPGMTPVPLDSSVYRFRKAPTVVVSEMAEFLEQEPNDVPAKATVLTVPCVANGRIWREAAQIEGSPASLDRDDYRFTSPAGKTWVIETDAARRGSPIDTKIEVLSADGKPIERLLLQATRDSYITFRPINSNQLDARVKNWEEMELNEFMYLQGEVCKLLRMPQGPDSGFQFYGRGGNRICYFDTSPTTHALDEPCYIVEPHPPGTPLVPNGLPVFPLHYVNDDAGDRRLSTDSRLMFTAPASGDYVVRVTDTRQADGDRFAYRLVIREPRPDYTVSIQGMNPTVGATSGKRIRFTVNRTDGFDGPVHIDIAGVPEGYSIVSPLVIEAGHDDAETSLYATDKAAPPAAGHEKSIQITATARIGEVDMKKELGGLGKITLAPKPKLVIRIEPAEVFLEPGKNVPITLSVERNGFDGRIQFDVDNLPHGVIVDNIGLSGILIPEKQSSQQLFLAARKWVPEMDRTFFAVAKIDGEPASLPVLLKIRRKPDVAQAGK